MIARNILLSKDTGAHLHLCHCSTKNSVIMVKYAKLEHIPVSAEVCPHHFTLTSDDMVEGDTNYKMNPPLRRKEDVEALKRDFPTEPWKSFLQTMHRIQQMKK